MRPGFNAALFAAVLLAGCGPPPEGAGPAEPDKPAAIGTAFDTREVGAIAGRVHWSGPAPDYPPISVVLVGSAGKSAQRTFANPCAVRIDPVSGAVGGAVVALEGVAPSQSRPWRREPVCVEVNEERIDIRQGGKFGAIGFVRAGDEVEFVSRDTRVQVLSARGAAFLALALPDADRPVRRRLNRAGVVELSSGAGRYWQRAFLWVSPHSYCTLTDEQGRFQLDDVPPGEYQLVAWLPSGERSGLDRDPNTGMVLRYHYAEPLRAARSVRVTVRNTAAVDCVLMK